MTTFTFDTLEATRKLREAGFEEKQAETVVRVLSESHEQLVTREFMEIFGQKLLLKIGGIIFAATGILMAFIRLS